MCTMIAQQAKVTGSGKVGSEWIRINTVSVSYDHPFDMPLEYTLNLDFTNQAVSPGARVAVELDAVSAQKLVEVILGVMKQAEDGGYINPYRVTDG